MPPEPTDEREQEDGPFVVCLRCNEQVDATANYCPECGRSLDPALKSASAMLDWSMPTLRRLGREVARNPLAFFIRWGIYVFLFALGVRIFVGCVQAALN